MTIGEPINLYPWRVVSLAEHEQLAFAVVRCQPKDFRASLRRQPGGRLGNDATRYYLASIFDTLLSSQGSDAHQRLAHRARRRGWYPCRPPWRDNCSNLPASMLGRQIRDPLWERSNLITLGSLRGAHTSTSRWPAPTRSPCPPRWSDGSLSGVGSARGTGLLGAGWRPIRLASVPPSRADVENIR